MDNMFTSTDQPKQAIVTIMQHPLKYVAHPDGTTKNYPGMTQFVDLERGKKKDRFGKKTCPWSGAAKSTFVSPCIEKLNF